jgi:hypothetical protein
MKHRVISDGPESKRQPDVALLPLLEADEDAESEPLAELTAEQTETTIRGIVRSKLRDLSLLRT